MVSRSAATHPFAVTWQGIVGVLIGHHGELSVHARPELALAAAVRWRASMRPLYGSYAPWYMWSIVDRRSGEIVRTIT